MDNQTNPIVAPASLFDHGNSLFNYADQDDFSSDEALTRYANTLMLCVYDDFIGTARAALTPELHEGLRQLTAWKVKKRSTYNLSEKRLKKIETQVRARTEAILEQ